MQGYHAAKGTGKAIYAEALSLYTPHNGTQIYTVAYRGAVEYVVSIVAVA